MLISPIKLIEEGWITHPKCKTLDDWKHYEFISPNAIDFTLDQLFSFRDTNIFAISEQGKQMRGTSVVQPVSDRRSGLDYYIIEPYKSYDALSDVYVNVPEGAAAHLIIRSTFNRNGLFLTAGLYDDSFSGHIGFALHNKSGQANITPGTRIGQIMFFEADSYGSYQGQWNHQQGTHAKHQTN